MWPRWGSSEAARVTRQILLDYQASWRREPSRPLCAIWLFLSLSVSWILPNWPGPSSLVDSPRTVPQVFEIIKSTKLIWYDDYGSNNDVRILVVVAGYVFKSSLKNFVNYTSPPIVEGGKLYLSWAPTVPPMYTRGRELIYKIVTVYQ